MDWGMPWPGPALAAQAEAAGARAFCSGEFADLNAYVTTTEMAHNTSTAMVGPGIAYAFARSPFVHAAAVRHLFRASAGRVFLGLGAGTSRMNRDWFGVDSVHPAPRMGELIEVISAFLNAENGESVQYRGEFYSIDADIRAPVLGRLDVPILVGAFNKVMVQTAGRVADGVLGHGLFTDRWWTELVEPALARGAESSGRDAADLRRWGWVITAVDDDDPQLAIREAKLQIAFYLTVRTYDSLVELHGWQDEVAAIRAAFRSNRPESIADRHLRRLRAGARNALRPQAIARPRILVPAEFSGRTPAPRTVRRGRHRADVPTELTRSTAGGTLVQHGLLSSTSDVNQEVVVSRQESLAPMIAPEATSGAVRSPKTAELVAQTLRRMIVDGQLTDGDFLPYEADLMTHFQVSRPTLREAVRVLESDRLVEVRRGSRTGAKVRVPGPEVVARPAALLLAISGTTLGDVMKARVGIEPYAARLLADEGSEEAHQELRRLVEQIPRAWETGRLAQASADLHRRMVELSGNASLAMIAGMFHDISERHTTAAILREQNVVPKAQYAKLLRSYGRLVDLVSSGKGTEAEAHWRRHMENASAALLKGYEKTKVRDIMY
jgi:5,10-methylenetetrahydromethanopterin reductase